MDYEKRDCFLNNLDAIGMRIQELCEQYKKEHTDEAGKPMTKDDFLAEHNIANGTYYNWLNGKTPISIEDAYKLCDIFGCDINYLLCEPGYNCKNKPMTDIYNATGLDNKVIDTLIALNNEISAGTDYSMRAKQIIELIDCLVLEAGRFTNDINNIIDFDVKKKALMNESYYPELCELYEKWQNESFHLFDFDKDIVNHHDAQRDSLLTNDMSFGDLMDAIYRPNDNFLFSYDVIYELLDESKRHATKYHVDEELKKIIEQFIKKHVDDFELSAQ